MKKRKIICFFVPICIVLLIILGIIIFPNDSLEAAKEGIEIWTTILIPSLLPFIIGANLIVDLKIVDIIGFIINPFTKFIFNVSGKSALVFLISTVSGYPVGAKLASELRLNSQISRDEGQRLISFCSTSGPLFIIGAVATGMFKHPNLGYLMIICHYLGSISIGLFFRGYGKDIISSSSISLKSNIKNTINTRFSNGQGFFVLFGNAVNSGVNTLLMIGGFVIVFSVIFKVLTLFKIVDVIAFILYIPLSLLGFTKELCYGLISGLFEITIGCNKISSVSNVSEALKASLASFLIGFSGISILAQCCTFISKTDISVPIYILSKFFHGIISGILTFLLYPLIESISLVSNFSSTYNYIYHGSVSNFYLSNYNTVLLTIFIVYILNLLSRLEKVAIKKES